MQNPLINKWQRSGLSVLPCLFLMSKPCLGQFVEVHFQMEGTSWPKDSSGHRTEHRRICDARCIFGTNLWMIEDEFTRNSKDSYWSTGTNIIWHTVITKELPDRERKRSVFNIAGEVPKVGERSTRILDPSAKRPLSGIAHISWMSFCSGSFLKANGRLIQLPFPTQIVEGDCSDITQLFNDELGLPERVEVYTREKELVSVMLSLNPRILSAG